MLKTDALASKDHWAVKNTASASKERMLWQYRKLSSEEHCFGGKEIPRLVNQGGVHAVAGERGRRGISGDADCMLQVRNCKLGGERGLVQGSWGAEAQEFEIGGMRDRALGSVVISLYSAYSLTLDLGRKSWENHIMG